MSSAKILYICQEVTPYVPETPISRICRYLPQAMQEKGNEIRVFMPRYGCINERRNQLHEVIRLSGMNLIIDDTDHQLIIKVASIPNARVQVYFIDNEDFFHRKATVHDADGNYFEDNDERAIFFARGVLETVKKLRWAPDVVHCHGWFSALAPVYLKRIFNGDPIFSKVKVVTSLYDDQFPGKLDSALAHKLREDGVKAEETSILEDPDYTNLMRFALDYSDGVIAGSLNTASALEDYTKKLNLPVLGYQSEDSYIEAYSDFYEEIITK